MTKLTTAWLTSDASRAVTDMCTAAGYEIYFVGGCVRNALVGIDVTDLDLATNARPETIIQLATDAGLRVIPTGIDHGTVTVMSGQHPYEITTFRNDVETDGRRAAVAFSESIEEDAIRRDFTMNALYCGADGEVIDPVGGIDDLRAKNVRFINDPDMRIREDYLRILRFFRFYAWFGDPENGPDPEGLAACAAHLDGLETLAKERVQVEILKTLMARNPAPAVACMAISGVLLRILPGADASALAPLMHLEEEAGIPVQWHTRLAAISPGDVKERLRLSKADAAEFYRIHDGAISGQTAGGLGYTIGANCAVQSLMLRAAMTGQMLHQDDVMAARFGALQVFPVKAADLMDDFEGKALGDRLRDLEAAWIASDFCLSKKDLIASI